MIAPRQVTRAAIVAEALSWIGTPYRHQASLKGVGCDCLGLIRGVWRALFGAEPEQLAPYTPDWAEAGGEETFAAAARRHLRETTVSAAEPGDVLLFRWRPGLPAKHAGVLVEPHRFVHAHQGAAVSFAGGTKGLHTPFGFLWRRTKPCPVRLWRRPPGGASSSSCRTWT
jgi:NlpC/P60 family putative phage cell wall peptidase